MTSSSRGGVLAPPTTKQALALVNVEVIYNQVILVLRGLSLTVGEGEVVALLGSNGAGKSTTLKAITGLLPSEDGEVTQGRILHEGESINGRDAAEIVRRGISLVMEGRRIFEHLTAEENLRAGAYTRRSNVPQQENLDLVYEYFPRLYERRRQTAGYLSGGEQQMLAIGRALMAQPKLLLLDEPSLGLAPKLVTEIFEIIRRLNDDLSATIIVVEQNARLALEVSDRALVMQRGRIALEGRADELADDRRVRDVYLGHAALDV
jgi:branched-chain amino acid transport system ATP-binding protein